jgi:hypothetical protein
MKIMSGFVSGIMQLKIASKEHVYNRLAIGSTTKAKLQATSSRRIT